MHVPVGDRLGASAAPVRPQLADGVSCCAAGGAATSAAAMEAAIAAHPGQRRAEGEGRRRGGGKLAKWLRASVMGARDPGFRAYYKSVHARAAADMRAKQRTKPIRTFFK